MCMASDHVDAETAGDLSDSRWKKKTLQDFMDADTHILQDPMTVYAET